MSFLDLDEALIDIAGQVDICYSPIVDVKVFPEDVDIAIVEGAVANEDHLHEIRRIRERTKVLIAFGDCAVTGNVTALRNLYGLDDILNRAYGTAFDALYASGKEGLVPRLLPRVLRIQDVVAVDYFLPGCPPPASAIGEFLSDLLAGRTPAAGRKFGS
jgi:NAD-reducing hydrogenase small subunit